MPDPSSPQCGSPNGSTRSGRGHRSAPWPTVSTMRSRRPSTGSTRPSASTGPTPTAGTTSTRSSWPPCRGCTGSTTIGSTATATTYRPRSTKQRSTLPNKPTPPGLESNSPSLHQTQGGSVAGSGGGGGTGGLLELDRGDLAGGGMDPGRVVPVDPAGGLSFDLGPGGPAAGGVVVDE